MPIIMTLQDLKPNKCFKPVFQTLGIIFFIFFSIGKWCEFWKLNDLNFLILLPGLESSN